MKSQFWLKFVNTFGFTGLSPIMPGTVGTLASAPIAWWLHSSLSLEFAAGVVIAVILLSIAAAHLYVTNIKSDDPSEIVIDEVAGFFVATIALPLTLTHYALAFIIFRALDILKPPPISYLDRKIKGGLGVVIDDVAAGLITHLLLRFVIDNGYLDKFF